MNSCYFRQYIPPLGHYQKNITLHPIHHKSIKVGMSFFAMGTFNKEDSLPGSSFGGTSTPQLVQLLASWMVALLRTAAERITSKNLGRKMSC